MKRADVRPSVLALGVMIVAGVLSSGLAEAQGLAGSPEMKAKQLAIEKAAPQLQITDEVLYFSIPGQTMGQTEGVSMNSKGHLFVYSRTGASGIARGGTAAMLFEFDPALKYVKTWGPNSYAASFAHSVRVDKYDNVWMVDEGSGMIVKFDPAGMPRMQFGRTLEAIDYLEAHVERGEKIPEDQRHPVGRTGIFNRPTDVTWDSKDNIYVSDGYGNSRVVKIAPGGHWLKTVGTYGNGPDQFVIPHSIASDKQDNIYVADRNNWRIQVYDSDLNLKKSLVGMASPWGVCVTPGSPQYLISGDGTTGKIYKMDLDGKLLGWAQTSLGQGEDDAGRLIHMIHCESNNVIYKGSAILWQVEKITIK
ncbi:MAG: 6-bladed beta-propeller [Acidobacteriota bacterium]